MECLPIFFVCKSSARSIVQPPTLIRHCCGRAGCCAIASLAGSTIHKPLGSLKVSAENCRRRPIIPSQKFLPETRSRKSAAHELDLPHNEYENRKAEWKTERNIASRQTKAGASRNKIVGIARGGGEEVAVSGQTQAPRIKGAAGVRVGPLGLRRPDLSLLSCVI